MGSFPIQKYLEVLYCILILSWSITSIVLSAIMFSRMETIEGNFQSLLDNWKAEVITDIQVVYASPGSSNQPQDCPIRYESFLSYTWPGTQTFCVCTGGNTMLGRCCNSGSSYRRVLRRRSSSRSSSSSGSSSKNKCNTCYGSQQSEVGAKTFDRFQYNSAVNYRVCVQRLTGYSFFNKASENGKGNCKDGFKSAVSTPINQFCVPLSESDPVRGFSISWAANVPTVTLDRNSDKSPLVQLTCQKSGGVCLDWKMNTLSGGLGSFKFLKKEYESLDICIKDTRWTPLETQNDHQMTEKNFFILNAPEILNIATYSNYVSSSDNLKIFQRGIIPYTTDTNCRESIKDYQILFDGINYLSDWLIVAIVFSSLFTAVSIFECIMGIAMLSDLPASEEVKFRYGIYVIPWNDQGDQLDNKLKIILCTIKAVFYIVFGLSLGLIFTKTQVMVGFCDKQLKCYTDQTDLNVFLLNDTKKSIQSSISQALFIFFLIRLFFEPTIFQILKIVFQCSENNSIFDVTYKKSQTFSNISNQNTQIAQIKENVSGLPYYIKSESKNQILIDRGTPITPEFVQGAILYQIQAIQNPIQVIQLQNFSNNQPVNPMLQ